MKLFLLALAVAAGWDGPTSPGYSAGIDGHTVFLKSTNPGAKADAIRQRIHADVYRGKRIRLSGSIKADRAEHGGALWLRVDMANGDYILDNVVDLTTGGWTKRQIVADVPPDAIGISFGLRMKGQGQVWASGLALDIVSNSIPTTTIERRKDHDPGAPRRLRDEYSRAPLHPVNLSFDQP